jgi:hypothetical protein
MLPIFALLIAYVLVFCVLSLKRIYGAQDKGLCRQVNLSAKILGNLRRQLDT